MILFILILFMIITAVILFSECTAIGKKLSDTIINYIMNKGGRK